MLKDGLVFKNEIPAALVIVTRYDIPQHIDFCAYCIPCSLYVNNIGQWSSIKTSVAEWDYVSQNVLLIESTSTTKKIIPKIIGISNYFL